MYQSSLAHILAELERIDLLLQMRLASAQHSNSMGLPQDEVLSLLTAPHGLPHWAQGMAASNQEAELLATIDATCRESIRAGIPLRLITLGQLFRLSSFEIDVLLVALAHEIEPRYGVVFAALQPDTRQAQPTVDLVLNL